MNLGENIYNLRVEKNLSQGGLADALEVSRQSVSKWENNSAVPELDKLVKMAEIFGVTIDQLVTGKAPEQPESQVIYIEKPVKQGITPAQILGIILVSCTLLFCTLFTCFGDIRSRLSDVLSLCLPLVLCGILCMVAKRPLFWFGWICTAILWVGALLQVDSGQLRVPGFGFLHATTLWLGLSVIPTAATLIHTIRLHKAGSIRVPAWGWWLLAAGFSVVILVICTYEPKAYLWFI